jgi:hypothetical protein
LFKARIFLALALVAAGLHSAPSSAKLSPAPPSISSPAPAQAVTSKPVAAGPTPAEINQICDGFLKAIQNGDEDAARKFVAPYRHADLKADFDRLQKLLKSSPPLTQQFADKTPTDEIGPNDNIWTIGYTISVGDRWKNAKLRLFYLRGEKPEIDHWEIADSDAALTNAAMDQAAQTNLVLQFIGINLLIAIFGATILLAFFGLRSPRPSNG